MSDFLVIRPTADQDDRFSWVIASSDGQSTTPETGSLVEAVHRAQQRPVVVLVPGSDVLVTRIDLPVRGTNRMLQAVPYALEEEIADSVGDLHFSIGGRDAAGKVTVAAVRDQLMQQWLAQFTGLNIVCMLPETCGIPVSAGVCVVVDGAQSLIRDGLGNALVAPTDDVAAFAGAMGINEVDDTPAELYVSSADAASYSQVLGALRIAIPGLSTFDARDGVLPIIAREALADPHPNLLQGPYARSSSKEKVWQPWRTAAALAGVLLLAALGTKALEVMSLKSEMRQLNAEISSIAGEAMPGSRLVDPILQLEQLASSMRSSGGSSGDFLRMLDALSNALTAASSTTLGRLDYRSGLMDLTLTAPDVDTLDKIRRSIEDGGLTAEIQSANQRDDAIEGRIRISGQST